MEDVIFVTQGGQSINIITEDADIINRRENSIYLETEKYVQIKEMILWQQSLCLKMLT